MALAEINGTHLEYDDEGVPDGPPVVFIHGWTANRHRWDHQVSTLAKTHRVIRYDLRGHGESDVPSGGYTIAQMAEDLRALLDHLGIERATLVGHSMGGMTALTFALEHPTRVERLVLVGSIACMLYDPSRKLLTAAGKRLPYPLFVRLNIERAFSRRYPRHLKEEQIRASQSNARHVVMAAFASMEQFDVLDRLGEIEVPTLIIHGVDDIQLPLTQARRMKRALPGARLVLVEAGHECTLEAPEEVSDALADFLALPG